MNPFVVPPLGGSATGIGLRRRVPPKCGTTNVVFGWLPLLLFAFRALAAPSVAAGEIEAPAQLRVAVAQPLVVPGEVAKNIAAMEPLVAEAAQRGARLVVFSECGVTGYDLQGQGLRAAIALGHPALDAIAQMARKNRIAIVAGFYERLGDTLHNTAGVFLPDGRRVIQRKHRIMDGEKAVGPVAAGPRQRERFEIDGYCCAVLICADAGIPGIFAQLSQDGCDAVVLIAAGAGSQSFGFHQADLALSEKRNKYAQAAASCLSPESIGQCIQLDIAQVACNQAGWDAATGYFHPGGSSIVDRTGQVTAVLPPTLIFERLRPELAIGSLTKRASR